MKKKEPKKEKSFKNKKTKIGSKTQSQEAYLKFSQTEQNIRLSCSVDDNISVICKLPIKWLYTLWIYVMNLCHLLISVSLIALFHLHFIILWYPCEYQY